MGYRIWGVNLQPYVNQALFWNIVAANGVGRQVFVKVFRIELQDNSSNGTRADIRSQTEGQTWPAHKVFFC
jgi:hypothetical protein